MASLKHIQIDQFPQSVDDFVALRDAVAKTPQGGAAMMVVALLTFAGDEALGQPCLTVAVDRGRLHEGYKGWQLHKSDMRRIEEQIARQPYLPQSYIKGATPENGYTLPAPPYTFEFSDNAYSGDPASGTYRVFVACSGAASPRPATLKRNDKGFWKASEWSSLVVGVQAPAAQAEDDL